MATQSRHAAPTRRSVSAGSRTTSSGNRASAGAHGAPRASYRASAQPAASGILAGGVFRKAGEAIESKRQSYRAGNDGGKRSNVFTIIIAAVAVVVIALLLDFFLHLGRIHPNVYVGEVNLGGLTKEKAVLALDAHYNKTLGESAVVAYISPNVKSQKQADELHHLITVNETYLENHPEIMQRVITMSELEGSVASSALVEEAFKYGRGFSGLFTRISLLFNPYVIEPYAYYGPVALENVAASFNDSIGVPMKDCTVWIEGGIVGFDEGQDGYTVSTKALSDALNKAFFATEAKDRSFVLYSTYTPMLLGVEKAQAVVDQLNAAIGDGVACYYNGNAWSAGPITVGSWIRVNTVAAEDGTPVVTFDLDDSAVHAWMLKWILEDERDTIPVKMEVDKKGKVMVYPDISGKIPALTEATRDLRIALFGDETHPHDVGADAIDGIQVTFDVGSMSVSSSMTIDEAIATGVVSPIASFSTSYINASTTDNRTANVLCAAGIVDGTIVKAGEEFSFNAIVGATTEDKGFKVGTVIDWTGEYVEGVGGGVCQVSTTMFNAVYWAGFPVTERRFHSLYSANYPDGLDAMVEYPTTDFKWVNDTNSDIYIKYTDDGTSITCTLYGEDPHRVVWSHTFDWVTTAPHPTKYLIDTTKNPGFSEVKTHGVDARTITVWRKVLEPDGYTLREDRNFDSRYDAITEYVIIGPSEFAEEQLAAGNASYLTE